MKITNTRFDDPEDLGDPSRIFVSTMMRFETLDYARRYFERKGDRSSMQRAQEIRKLYKETILNSVYIMRSIIPDEVKYDSYHAREKYLKEREEKVL
jgi:hypothetical protein